MDPYQVVRFASWAFFFASASVALATRRNQNTESGPEARVTERMLTFGFSFPPGLRSITLSTNFLKSAEVCFGLVRLSLNM
jgi:hypothetical protein